MNETIKKKSQYTFLKGLERTIQAKVNRFGSLPQEINNISLKNEATYLERQFPFLLRNANSSIQQHLFSPTQIASILHIMENLEYRLLILELSRGINSEGWEIYEYTKDKVIIIAHPNFENPQAFSEKLVEAIRASRKKVNKTRILNFFDIELREDPNKDIIFLVEDGDVWRIIGAQQLEGKMDLWWVRELGDNISLFYTKGRKNLNNLTLLTSNRFHEFTHRCQYEVLIPLAYNRFFPEFSLLEGMATWWEPILVRHRYRERDFLAYYLLNDKFMATFLRSDQLLLREGHQSLKYPWNAVFTGILFQKTGVFLGKRKKQRVESDDTFRPLTFDYRLVKKGLQIISKNLRLANELVDDAPENLTELFLDTLFNRRLGLPLSFREVADYYDCYGYNYALSLLLSQALTNEEKQALEEQKKQYFRN